MSEAKQKIIKIEKQLRTELEADQPIVVRFHTKTWHTTGKTLSRTISQIQKIGAGLPINGSPIGQNQTDSEIATMARQHLANWTKDCNSSEGVKNIVSCGSESEFPLLQILSLAAAIQRNKGLHSGTDKTAKQERQEAKQNPITDWFDYIGRCDSNIKIFYVLPVMILCLKDRELSEKLLSSAKKWMQDIMADSTKDTDLDADDAMLLGVVNGMLESRGGEFTLDSVAVQGSINSEIEAGENPDEDAKYPITKQVEQFFRALPTAGKIAIKLHSAIGTAQMEFGSETGCLDKLDDVISDCVEDVKTDDPKLNQMLGLARFMELTRDKNSITIAG